MPPEPSFKGGGCRLPSVKFQSKGPASIMYLALLEDPIEVSLSVLLFCFVFGLFVFAFPPRFDGVGVFFLLPFLWPGPENIMTQCVVDIAQALTQLALMGVTMDSLANARASGP